MSTAVAGQLEANLVRYLVEKKRNKSTKPLVVNKEYGTHLPTKTVTGFEKKLNSSLSFAHFAHLGPLLVCLI